MGGFERSAGAARGRRRRAACATLLATVVGAAGVVIPHATAGAADGPELGIGDVVIPEGDAGVAVARVTVTLSEPVVTDTFVTFATASTSATAGVDYVERHGRVRVRAGKVAATIAIKVVADVQAEGDEVVTITLTDAGGVTLADPVGSVTVRDDDARSAGRVAIGDAALREGDAGFRTLRLPVVLDRPLAGDVTLRFQVVPASATSDDVVVRTGSARVRAGRTQATIVVKVLADRGTEADETFAVVLSSVVGAVVADDTGVGTVYDDDPPTATPPAAPTVTTLVAGPGVGQLTVGWSVPNDGGAAISGYDLEVDRPAGLVVGAYSAATTGATFTCGSPGITCTVRVRARNAMGPGPWSSPAVATTFRAPSVVGDLAASGGLGSIHATWAVPADAGDFPVLDYVVERSDDGDAFTTVAVTDVRAATVACPGERSTCHVRVRARNAAGYGPTATVAATTWARPGAPTLVSIRRINELVGLGWTPPDDDGGTPIVDYVAERSIDGGTTWVALGPVLLTPPTCPIGVSCSFRVRARNVVGEGSPSNVLLVGP